MRRIASAASLRSGLMVGSSRNGRVSRARGRSETECRAAGGSSGDRFGAAGRLERDPLRPVQALRPGGRLRGASHVMGWPMSRREPSEFLLYPAPGCSMTSRRARWGGWPSSAAKRARMPLTRRTHSWDRAQTARVASRRQNLDVGCHANSVIDRPGKIRAWRAHVARDRSWGRPRLNRLHARTLHERGRGIATAEDQRGRVVSPPPPPASSSSPPPVLIRFLLRFNTALRRRSLHRLLIR